MINDGVCDEVTNNEKCLFDGKDCCIQNTNIDDSLCLECICKLDIDMVELNQKFKDYDVQIHLDSINDHWETFKDVKVINNVENEEVCALLCLPGEENRYNTPGEATVDSWIYNGQSQNRTCSCTQMEFCYLKKNIISPKDYKAHCNAEHPVKRHIMLKEAFDCGKLF